MSDLMTDSCKPAILTASHLVLGNTLGGANQDSRGCVHTQTDKNTFLYVCDAPTIWVVLHVCVGWGKKKKNIACAYV